MTRRIANREHNIHVANGVEKHTPTSIAPSSLMRPLSEEQQARLLAKQAVVEQALKDAIGEPYFKDAGFILYHRDSLASLNRLNESMFQVDLTITSPPYNIGKEYEEPLPASEYIDWCEKWMSGVYSITKDAGLFWLNVGYLEIPEKGLCVPIPYLLWDKSRFYLIQEVVWTYGAGVQTKRRLSPRNEKWLFYAKDPKNYTFHLDDIRDPNVKYPNQKKGGKYRCNPLGKNPSDVWEFPKVTTGSNRSSKERTGHPAQFPLGVVERIVRACSSMHDVVLDPFAGSSSAGIAAAGLGRIFVGFELREDYCELSKNRYLKFMEEHVEANRQAMLI